MLKTLNDICYSEYLTKKMIKQEAIKWVKESIKEGSPNWDMIKFHNITESDLEETNGV